MVDYIIVGCGLAGISFAEQALNNNNTIVVFDNDSQKSSRIAGGLYNPVILKRFSDIARDLSEPNAFVSSRPEILDIRRDLLRTGLDQRFAVGGHVLGPQLSNSLKESIPILQDINKQIVRIKADIGDKQYLKDSRKNGGLLGDLDGDNKLNSYEQTRQDAIEENMRNKKASGGLLDDDREQYVIGGIAARIARLMSKQKKIKKERHIH